MKITSISYAAEVHTYSDAKEKIVLSAELSMQDSNDESRFEEVCNQLKDKVHKLLNDEKAYNKHVRKITEAKCEYEKLLKALANAKTQWENTTAFLKAQGIKSDFPELDIKSLPAVGEIIDVEF